MSLYFEENILKDFEENILDFEELNFVREDPYEPKPLKGNKLGLYDFEFEADNDESAKAKVQSKIAGNNITQNGCTWNLFKIKDGKSVDIQMVLLKKGDKSYVLQLNRFFGDRDLFSDFSCNFIGKQSKIISFRESSIEPHIHMTDSQYTANDNLYFSIAETGQRDCFEFIINDFKKLKRLESEYKEHHETSVLRKHLESFEFKQKCIQCAEKYIEKFIGLIGNNVNIIIFISFLMERKNFHESLSKSKIPRFLESLAHTPNPDYKSVEICQMASQFLSILEENICG